MSETGMPYETLLERRTAQLRASDERFRTMIEENFDGIVIVNGEGQVRYANPAAQDLFGRSHSELRADHLGFPMVRAGSCEVQIRRSDGSTRVAEMRVKAIDWDNEPAYLADLRDVTDRKKLEDQLRQAQKLEAVGLLAAGIAHDFNNLLTVIIGSGQMIRDCTDPTESRELAGEIIDAAGRASSLTSQLLAFGRRQILRPKILEIGGLIADLSKILRRLLGEHIQLEVIPAPADCFINADPGQIEQVLMNLVVNSRDALPKGGRIIIGTAPVQLTEGQLGTGVPRGPYVKITVTDNGHGIDEATMSHIFEPFFTTKERAQGTGLGLSTVYGIVKQSGGEIEVESQPGNGTTFRIYLPEVQAAQESWDRDPSARAPMGTGTVLVVEDEVGVRKMVRLLLQKLGYTVLDAGSGPEALRLAEEHRGKIDLLFTDVVMPDMGGGELANRLSAMRPEIRVLFMSGYVDDLVLEHGVSKEKVPFLQKPFSKEQLADQVRLILEDTRAGA
jgi:two-component system, cell cycle sensor histidine kinase and response regulator CckA